MPIQNCRIRFLVFPDYYYNFVSSKLCIMKENKTKKTYIKPESEIINLELEQPILSGSGTLGPDYDDGGYWG